MTKTIHLGLILLALLLVHSVHVQTRQVEPLLPGAATPQPQPAQDSLGRTTPHGTVVGLITAVEQANLERAAEYLESGLSPSGRRELAQKLGTVLDRKLLTSLDSLSDEPDGDAGDGLTDRDSIGVVESSSGSVEIFLDRVRRGRGAPLWLFSSSTLQEIPRVYDELEPPWIEQYVPDWLRTVQWLSIPLYRWIGWLLLVPLALGLAALFTRWLKVLLRPVVLRLGHDPDVHGLTRVGPLHLLILATLFYGGAFVGLDLAARLFWTRVAVILMVLAVSWFSLRLVDILAALSLGRLARVNRSADTALLRLIGRLSKAAIVIVTGLLFLYLSNVDLTAALTGLGVGGLAIGFGAQKTIENLFGGIMVISDKPVNVGDICKVGEYMGTVEDIGIRSTRIRTLDRTVVSVPNGQLAIMILENFAERDRILFHHTIGLGHQTTAEQLRDLLAQIQGLLAAHPKVDAASARTRFIGFSAASLNLEVFAYVLESEQPAFLAIQEDLLLSIIDTIDSSGASIAAPALTLPPLAPPLAKALSQ